MITFLPQGIEGTPCLRGKSIGKLRRRVYLHEGARLENQFVVFPGDVEMVDYVAHRILVGEDLRPRCH
jgi:hypothetical protein